VSAFVPSILCISYLKISMHHIVKSVVRALLKKHSNLCKVALHPLLKQAKETF
jgi:hypothetical protein